MIAFLLALAAAATPEGAVARGPSPALTASTDSIARYGSTLLPAAIDTVLRVSAAPDSHRASAPDSAPPFRLVAEATLAARTGTAAVVDQPAGLAVDAFGRVLVSDAGLHRVQQLEPGGAPRWQAGSLGSEAGEMRRPTSVAPLGTLELAVLDVENRRVVAYDLFGRLQGVRVDLAALEQNDPVGRIDPVAMATDRGGALMLADAERDRLIAFDFSGRRVGTVGGIGTRPGSFRGLRGLAVTPRGELLTAERGNARVQRLTSGGRVLESWALAVQPGRARLAMAADDSGRVAVADEASGTLWLFGRGGALLARLEGLEGPSALAFAGGRELLVAEARGGRVRRFRIEALRTTER